LDVNATLSFKERRVQKLRCRGDRMEWRHGLYYIVARRCDVTWSIDLIDKYSFFVLGEEASVCLYTMLRGGKGVEMGKIIRINNCNDGISALIRRMTFQVATWREITHYTVGKLMRPLSSQLSRPVSVKSRSCLSLYLYGVTAQNRTQLEP
jgi:hypothetical protein